MIFVEMAQRGQVTIPKAIRDRYNLEPGQKMSVVDIGGALVLTPKKLVVDDLCDRLCEELAQSGGTLEEMLADLRAIREGREV